LREGLLYEDIWSQKQGTIRNVADASEFEGPPSRGEALEIVQEEIKMHVGRATKLTVAPSPDVAGQAVYKVMFDNEERHRYGELVVDKSTDLPISAQIWGGNPDQHVRWEYRFNVSFPKGFFDPRPGRRFVDLRKTIPALEARWRRPIASLKGVEVLDACVTPNGTVWIAARCESGGSTDLAPTKFKGADGVTYAYPVQMYSRSPKGQEIRVYGYEPISPMKTPLRKCSLTFNPITRSRPIPNSDNMTAGQELDSIGTVTIPVRPEPVELPAYFADLGVEGDLLNLPEELDWNRAGALERVGRYGEAGDIYYRYARQTTPALGGFVSIRKQAERCYAIAGNKAAVARIEAELAQAEQGAKHVGP
jgi:hypothetical protein